MATIRDSGFQLLKSPTIFTRSGSVWLAYLSTFDLKDPLRAQTFDSDEELNHTINGWFEQQDKHFFMDGIKSLVHRWENVLCLREIALKNSTVIWITDVCKYVFLTTYWSTLIHMIWCVMIHFSNNLIDDLSRTIVGIKNLQMLANPQKDRRAVIQVRESARIAFVKENWMCLQKRSNCST